MPEWIVALLASGATGLAGLIVWIVHTLAKPWFNARAKKDENRYKTDTELEKERFAAETSLMKRKLEIDERFSLNGYQTNEKMMERLMTNADKFYDSLLRTSESLPNHLTKIYDKMDVLANKIEVNTQKMDVVNESMKVLLKKLDAQDAMMAKHEKDSQYMMSKFEEMYIPPSDTTVTKKTETISVQSTSTTPNPHPTATI